MENDLSTGASLAWIFGMGAVSILVIQTRSHHYTERTWERFGKYVEKLKQSKNHDQ